MMSTNDFRRPSTFCRDVWMDGCPPVPGVCRYRTDCVCLYIFLTLFSFLFIHSLKQVMEYEYDAAVESAYRQSMLKTFKKTLDDGFFNFVMIDACNVKLAHFQDFWRYAKTSMFEVYIAEMDSGLDATTLEAKNVHRKTESEIREV